MRRAERAVGELDAGPARRALRHTVDALTEGADAGAVARGLLGYGAVLERHGVHRAAEEVYCAVLDMTPGEAVVALHAARAARKAGRREVALELYRRAGSESGGDANLLLLVRIGEALVSDTPAEALTGVIRDARRSRAGHAVAVAREERARELVSQRRSGAALRDLAAAAGRYRDAQDRIRVLHRMAELLTARGDLLAAREVLHAALDLATTAQRGHTVQRLRTVARSLGDELELRRLRGLGSGALVTLAPGASRRLPAARSLAPRLRRWRGLLTPLS